MYKFKQEKFEGPLDLLLNLIEEEKFNITDVSLAQAADQYVQYLESHPEISPEELADFLVVATKLLLLKSKQLIPDLKIDEEDDPTGLAKQLRIYREYQNALKVLEQMVAKRQFLFWREKPPVQLTPKFSPGKELNSEKLRSVFSEIIRGIEKLVVLPQSVMERTVSLQEKIGQIKDMIKNRNQLTFNQILLSSKSKTELIVSFLALLELVKQQEIHVHQEKNFGDILIKVM